MMSTPKPSLPATAQRREREREARRASILQAAEQVFLARGVDVATMDEIAAAAELSKGSLYLYFKNKASLCAAIGDRNIRECLAELRPEISGTDGGLEKVRVFLVGYLGFAQRRPNHVKLLLGWMVSGWESDHSSPEFASYRARIGEVLGLFVGAIENGKADGSIRSACDSFTLAMQLWSGLLGTLLPSIHPEEASARLPVPIDLSQLGGIYIENMLRAIGGETR